MGLQKYCTQAGLSEAEWVGVGGGGAGGGDYLGSMGHAHREVQQEKMRNHDKISERHGVPNQVRARPKVNVQRLQRLIKICLCCIN